MPGQLSPNLGSPGQSEHCTLPTDTLPAQVLDCPSSVTSLLSSGGTSSQMWPLCNPPPCPHRGDGDLEHQVNCIRTGAGLPDSQGGVGRRTKARANPKGQSFLFFVGPGIPQNGHMTLVPPWETGPGGGGLDAQAGQHPQSFALTTLSCPRNGGWMRIPPGRAWA